MYCYAHNFEDVVKLESAFVLAVTAKLEKPKDTVRTSKTLSAILRHDKQGNRLRKDGWALMEKLPVKPSDAMFAVRDNNKERFCVARGVKTGKLYVVHPK
jgi:RNA:NAD 2'-phosphotransferase (TPT1/KptA family)